ncbi:probable sulfotransferase [Crocosphaera subtropica ATCC 51142]|uniref:Probable sulfotransferase n=1 Tax=Crocosphaera subtropica (strain ATCC 51142 / BH68) TaxID=43989 RepID=B1WWE5_CROS5|nr:sulfotransferase [Crocosphaera subtropica]ACB54073.1 probable sulfotransferase [Crocosphaera subtropica ATCC 51142]
MKKLPNFIIIGAMKCATSSLHEQLNQQPGIFMSELKEPNFFSNDEEYSKGLNWYLSHFKEANINDLRGESSTHYSKLPTYPHTIERLQKHLPNAKFIYVMRHPINRLVSQYIHEWSQRVISEEINESLDRYPELIEYSLYTKQLQPYFDTFGKERVLPIFFERMLTTPQTELEKICHFIGYTNKPRWDEQLNASNVSSERMIKSDWRDAMVEAPGLKQLRRLLIPKSFRTWVRSLWTIKKKPELTSENIEKLTKIFDQDLAVLGSWLRVELTCDNFQETVKHSSLNWVNTTRI